mgnify:CR=1 FL=1
MRVITGSSPKHEAKLGNRGKGDADSFGTSTPLPRIDPKDLEIVSECAACSGRAFRHFATSDGLDVVRCLDCTLLFSNPRVPGAALKAFFAESYLESEDRLDREMSEHRWPALIRTSKIVQALCPSGGRLLDVGAASGAFLGMMKQHFGWKVAGVEPSGFAARSAAQRHGVPIHHGYLHEIDLDSVSFDVVSVLDTLFLDPQPHRTIAAARRILVPEGHLVVEIPGLNFRLLKNTGLIARIMHGQWAQLNPAMQMFFYDHHTLSRLLGRHGFELVARYAEQSPVYGPRAIRMLNELYFIATKSLFDITGGHIHLAPKELLVYRLSNQ